MFLWWFAVGLSGQILVATLSCFKAEHGGKTEIEREMKREREREEGKGRERERAREREGERDCYATALKLTPM